MRYSGSEWRQREPRRCDMGGFSCAALVCCDHGICDKLATLIFTVLLLHGFTHLAFHELGDMAPPGIFVGKSYKMILFFSILLDLTELDMIGLRVVD